MVKHTGEHADGRDGKDKGRGAPAPSPGVTPPSTSMVSDMELSKLHPFGVLWKLHCPLVIELNLQPLFPLQRLKILNL